MDLSVALAVYNEESNIENCLKSVKMISNDIVIVDGKSTDSTVQIARKYGCKVIESKNYPIFHINKQKAIDLCSGDWILQLDADEVVSPSLQQEILALVHPAKISNIRAYYLARNNYFWGKRMNKGGLYPDYVVRLIKRGYAHFPCKSVHEQIVVDGEIGYCKHALDHYAYRNFQEYWMKADRYIDLTIDDMKNDKLPTSIQSYFLYMVVKPVMEFFNRVIRHKGILDGWQGIVFGYFSALHYQKAYIKYMKLMNGSMK